MRAQVELGCAASPPTLLAFGGFTIVCLQPLEWLLKFAVALAKLRADEVEPGQRLLEREQVFGAPVPLQAFGDFINAGADTSIFHRAQDVTITFASHDCTQNFLASLARDVGDDVGQLNVHLRERLLHVLYMPALIFEQHCTLTPQRAQHTHLVGWTKCAAEQA